MPRESKLSYEMVRAAAYRFQEKHGRVPRNRDIQIELGGATGDISKYMKTWREEVSALKKVKWKGDMKRVEAAVSLTVDEAVAAERQSFEEQLQAAQDDADDLRCELNKTTDERDDALEDLEKERQRRMKFETHLEDSRAESSRHHSELIRAQDEVKRLNQEKGQLLGELASERKKTEAMEAQLVTVNAANREMATKIQELENRFKLLQ